MDVFVDMHRILQKTQSSCWMADHYSAIGGRHAHDGGRLILVYILKKNYFLLKFGNSFFAILYARTVMSFANIMVIKSIM